MALQRVNLIKRNCPAPRQLHKFNLKFFQEMLNRIIIAVVAAFVLPLTVAAQFKVSGTVTDKTTGDVLPYATVEFGNYKTVVMEDGKFLFEKVKKGDYTLTVRYVGYEVYKKEVKVTKVLNLKVKMSVARLFNPVIIIGNRASDNTGTSFTNLTRTEIKKADVGMDLPYILDMTPGLVSTSDAGAGVGYTTMRIRGTDLSRINVTVNGIPFNDPESQGAWFVDLPDFAGSLQSIQVQRGVGTSVNGPAAFGASVDMQTGEIHNKPFAELMMSYGSFNTQRYRLSSSTGLIDGKYFFDVRLSKIWSDGYIDRAFSDMKSFFVSAGYVGNKSTLKLNIFSGKEKTYQAWYGVPKDSLETNRTMNPYTYDNETDNYIQTHYQLLYTNNLSKKWLLNAGLHYTKGNGYYENYKNNKKLSSYGLSDYIAGNDTIKRTDLVQQKWLDNDFYGMVFNVNYNSQKLKLNIGGAANSYDGDHYGNIIWTKKVPLPKDYEWYRNNGKKSEISAYAKATYQLMESLSFYGDIQYRSINYDMNGIHDDLHDLTAHYEFGFLNPKLGIVYKLNNRNRIYGSVAVANKEPSRNNYRDADAGYTPLPEKLTDYELGYLFNSTDKLLRFNFYYMDYKDQLVATGKVNNVGAAIMTNVDKSYRAGVEIIAGWKVSESFDWNFNVALSQNKILDFTEYVDNWDTWGQEEKYLGTTDISFSPAVVAKNSFNFHLLKTLDIALLSRYVGRQYIDNTSNKERSLDPYFVTDLRFDYALRVKGLKNLSFNLSINNILNEMYESNAWVYRYIYGGNEYEMNGYFPQAGINFMAGFRVRF
jgi:iron complex outermembrane receptor protein